ncbi:MAG TPA: alanine racemase [Thermoanaerobaculia bacterium]|jgi:alanine racemase|nr:alanine racemase [Thermoanaerobaculia bacterium]
MASITLPRSEPMAETPATERRPSEAELLASALRPAWVDVDLDVLDRNLAALRARMGSARILAVVKADAYGHGATGVSRALEAAGVDWLGVALLEEGAEVRRAGVDLPILVLGTARPEWLALYRRYELTPAVSSLAELALWREWSAGSATGAPQALHLKVDTGMGRLGVPLADAGRALEIIRSSPQLKLAGLLSHFANADDLTNAKNDRQESRFESVLAQLTARERETIEIHMANSAAALHRPSSRNTLVRMGIGLYGIDPVDPATTGDETGLAPVMSLVARIVQVREVPAGTQLSYGGRTITERPSRIAVVPVGYADGYAWRLTGKAEALVSGRRVPIAGSVTMDMTLLDITDTDAVLGDEAVLLGRQGDEQITAVDLARQAGTISWEILCHLGLRLPRRYFRGGKLDHIVSRFSRED